jgi:hypothetical protein
VRCSHAGLVLSHRGGKLETIAVTDPLVEQCDLLQLECGEGPSLGSPSEGHTCGRAGSTSHQIVILDPYGEEVRVGAPKGNG